MSSQKYAKKNIEMIAECSFTDKYWYECSISKTNNVFVSNHFRSDKCLSVHFCTAVLYFNAWSKSCQRQNLEIRPISDNISICIWFCTFFSSSFFSKEFKQIFLSNRLFDFIWFFCLRHLRLKVNRSRWELNLSRANVS